MMKQGNFSVPDGQKPKKKATWKKVLLILLLSLLLLIVAAVAAVGLYMNYLLGRVTPYDPSEDVTISMEEAEQLVQEDPEAVTLDPDSTEDIPDLEELPTVPEEPTDPMDAVNWDNVINIMLVGQDRRPGQGRQRSDTMILLTVNKSTGTITLTSFMRDQYVRIPGYKNNKLNAAYAFGGVSLMNETLETNFGVRVDGNVEVDFNSFQKLIDRLGGVDIKLTKKEASYLNAACGQDWSAGTHRLNGSQALVYARLREIDSDYNRAQRQRNVISSLIRRYQELPVTEMITMLEDVLPLVKTNMTKGQIIDYAMEVAPILPGANLETMRIPVDGTFRSGIARVRAGLAAWFQYDIDFAANREALRKIFAE